MTQATQTQAKAKATQAKAKPQAAKAASAPIAQAAKAATIACRIIDAGIVKFFAAAAGNGHKGRYTINAAGELTVTDAGAVHFAARLADSNKAAERKLADDAMVANVVIPAGKLAIKNVAWVANAAIIKNRKVALPAFAGAGDAVSQAAFARVIMAAVK